MENNRIGIVIGVIALAAIGLLSWNSFSRSTDSTAGGGGEKVGCVSSNLPVPNEYHIHPVLKIVVDGREVPMPGGIGLSGSCHRILHTHDGTGAIHVEPNFYKEYTLGDFFLVWGEPFYRDGYELKMTVDGEPRTEFESLILKDGQQILLEYTNPANS